MSIKANITFFTEGTPNGLKPTILLAELGLGGKLVTIDIIAQENKKHWFLKINPNGRIPAMTDVDGLGREIHVFGSGAILEYLVARYDKDNRVSYPYNSNEYSKTPGTPGKTSGSICVFVKSITLSSDIAQEYLVGHLSRSLIWHERGVRE